LVAAAKPDAAASDYLALARRFLPRIDFLGGTATEAPDPIIALRVLEAGIARRPGDAELLVLSSHVARLLSSYFLAIRHLEEAKVVLERTPAAADVTAKVSAELIELYFLRLRLRLGSGAGRSGLCRGRRAQTALRGNPTALPGRRHQGQVGRHRLRAGRAATSTPGRSIAPSRCSSARATRASRPPRSPWSSPTWRSSAAIRGAPARSSARGWTPSAPPRARATTRSDRSRDARASNGCFGDCTDAVGDHSGAEASWRSALIGWERLMIEHLRRKNLGESAEAAVEVGRLLYLLGRHGEGLQKFDEAIEEDGDRDQTYIDVVAFLVQQGETDAALSVYHRALSRPGRAVSEYVKVYTSLWVLDLSRRTSKLSTRRRRRFLRTLDRRHGDLRPRRGAAWYHLLAKYATGQLSYEQMLAAADTTGKRAEIYFYEGMRRLADGKADDAHQLWQKVVDTRMFSFFEFDMASRYLRVGAPTAPSAPITRATSAETI
jgi:tetratricopeptide (TPR) repeat protein